MKTEKKYCSNCKLVTEHEVTYEHDDDSETIISQCTICGEVDVNCDSIDIDIEDRLMAMSEEKRNAVERKLDGLIEKMDGMLEEYKESEGLK